MGVHGTCVCVERPAHLTLLLLQDILSAQLHFRRQGRPRRVEEVEGFPTVQESFDSEKLDAMYTPLGRKGSAAFLSAGATRKNCEEGTIGYNAILTGLVAATPIYSYPQSGAKEIASPWTYRPSIRGIKANIILDIGYVWINNLDI